MRAATLITAAAVACAPVASAYPYLSTRQSNATAQWGSWVVTSPSSNYPPSGSHKSLDFLVRYESQANTVHCSAYFPGNTQGVGPDEPYTPCDDEAVSFTSDLSIGNVWISQKLYQRSAIVLLKGSAPLYLYGRNCTTNPVGGGACSGPPFEIPVTSVSIQLANGTIIGNDSSLAAGDGVQGDDAADGNGESGQDSDGTAPDGDSSTDDKSDAATGDYAEATAIQEDSINSAGDNGSSEHGSSYDDGATYGNRTAFGNATSRGRHGNGKYGEYDA